MENDGKPVKTATSFHVNDVKTEKRCGCQTATPFFIFISRNDYNWPFNDYQ